MQPHIPPHPRALVLPLLHHLQQLQVSFYAPKNERASVEHFQSTSETKREDPLRQKERKEDLTDITTQLNICNEATREFSQ